MFIIWRHILRTHIAPFLFSVLLMMCIFLLQFLMKYLDQLAGKGLSAGIIAKLIMLNLAWMLVLAVPMGVLVATLMAFGQLAATNQITALRACGVGLYRMLLPVIIASVVLCYLMIRFNNDILPDANHQTKVLTTEISLKKPTLTIMPGMFIQLTQGHSILVRKTFEQSNDLEGVTIFDYSRPTLSSTITAHHGTISFSSDYRKLIMDLYDGEIHQVNSSLKDQYRVIRFEKHRIAMDAEGFNFQPIQEGFSQRGDRELSAQAMSVKVDSLRTRQQEAEERANKIGQEYTKLKVADTIPKNFNTQIGLFQRRQIGLFQQSEENERMLAHLYDLEARKYLVEIYKKYAIPFACIIFVFIGGPLGIMARRGTFGVGASLSLGFFTLYWACLRGGEVLADRGIVEPWLSMWIANIILGIFGLYLTYRIAHESLSINWDWFSKFLPKSWRIE